MSKRDFDFSKITRARDQEEWQRAFDEFSEFIVSGEDGSSSAAAHASSSPADPPDAAASPRRSSPPRKNIHAGHRERLRRSASNNSELLGFTDIEVLETLLSFFIPYKDTNPIAHALLDRFGTLKAVLRAAPDELFAVGSMTRTASEMLPLIADAPLHAQKFNVRLDTHRAAARFFASVFIGGVSDGVYVAFLDKNYRLSAIERHLPKRDGSVNIRAILGAIAKHNAASMIVARRESGIMLADDKPLKSMRAIKTALDYVGIKLLDSMIFVDYGYYSTAFSGADDEYVFLPIMGAVGSPELADALLVGGRRLNDAAAEPHGGDSR